MTSIFTDITLILATSTVLAAIFARLKQPVILSYLIIGIFAASAGLFQTFRGERLDFFSELGIALTLFLIGLNLRFSDIKQIGKTAVVIGIGQILFTGLLGFLLTKFLAFGNIEAVFLSLALTFSSTIIVINILDQKRDLQSLYGKITTGYLIVQDFVAIGALMFVTSVKKGFSGEFFSSLFIGLLLLILIFILNRFFLQRLFDLFAKNLEVLFIAALAWALIFSSLFAATGFSLEIGAFLAGLGLASLREQTQISAWVRPLRNLFIAIFFLGLGLQLTIPNLLSVLSPVLVLSLFVLVGNPLIMMIIMGALGYRSRTSFQVAITSAQVSEFSLILIALAFKNGLVGDKIVAVISATALFTFVTSTYLITYSSKIHKYLAPYLKLFQRGNLIEQPLKQELDLKDHTVLIGAGRLGWPILEAFLKAGEKVLVVDFDPKVIKKLEDLNIPCIYGDISDPEIFDKAASRGPKIIISTVVDPEDTYSILTAIKKMSSGTPVVVSSSREDQALEFYQKGALYVIVPRILTAHLMEHIFISHKFQDMLDGKLRKEHLQQIAEQKFEVI